jgi:hypothetical protein
MPAIFSSGSTLRHDEDLSACGFFVLYSPYTFYVPRNDRPSHRVYCTFLLRQRWQVQFCEADLKMPLPGSSPSRTRGVSGTGEITPSF